MPIDSFQLQTFFFTRLNNIFYLIRSRLITIRKIELYFRIFCITCTLFERVDVIFICHIYIIAEYLGEEMVLISRTDLHLKKLFSHPKALGFASLKQQVSLLGKQAQVDEPQHFFPMAVPSLWTSLLQQRSLVWLQGALPHMLDPSVGTGSPFLQELYCCPVGPYCCPVGPLGQH